MKRVAVLAVCLVSACAACTSPKGRLRKILAATQPADTVCLYEYDGTSSSATGGGGHTFVTSLYATQQTYEETFAAYREQLTSDGWEPFAEGVWRKTQPDGVCQIEVEDLNNWFRWPELYEIPAEVIAEGLQEHETLFIVSARQFQ